MLKLVLGRNYCNKTEYVRQLVADAVKSGGSDFIIIVPEQFSYDTEKGMLEKVGASGMQKLEVLSLTRLAELILEETGKKSDKMPVDKGVKILTMSLALEQLSDKLQIFRRYTSRPQLAQSIIALASEMKQYCVGVDALEKYAENADESPLKNKLGELSLIIETYNSMLNRDYYDNEDSLTLLAEVLDTYRYFEGKTVIIDEFTRFTKQELAVIERIIKQSVDCYVTFDTDYSTLNREFTVFDNINRQLKLIKRVAEQSNVRIAKPVVLNENEAGVAESLELLEKNFGEPEKETSDEAPEAITVYCASNKVDECDFVASSIKKLMREDGVRCRDIIVYQREKGGYDGELISSFKRYGVPFFEDRRQPVKLQPLMVFVGSLLSLVSGSITTQSLMRYLKTGLAELDECETAELENYAFMWNIKTSQWKDGFSDNPRGFGVEFNEADDKTLFYLNKLRERAVAPILKLKESFANASGSEKTELLYNFLIDNGVDKKLKLLCEQMSAHTDEALYEEQNTVWGILADMLDKLYLATKGRSISSKRYSELLSQLLSVTDLGSIPASLDSVTLALADRTRAGLKKYVFIVGANDGVFPKAPSTEGLLSDADRITLKDAGIELAETAEYKSVEEIFTAYRAVCSAKDGLCVSYCRSGYGGEAKMPSQIVNEITAVFPKLTVIDSDSLNAADRIESEVSAFEAYAKSCKSDSVLNASLESFFEGDSEYESRVRTLKNALNKTEKVIKDKKLAVELFGRDMVLSASKTETYNSCPFKYFCEYGIEAKTRKQATVDSLLSGTIIHEVFESILKSYSPDRLHEMSDEELRGEIEKILDEYLEKKMGGSQSKSNRFMAQYNALADRLLTVFRRMLEEFRISSFRPVEYEMRIGLGSKVKPYTIELDDGSKMMLDGKIDRVDVMKTEDKTYLRIVDYKNKGKTFNIGEVFYGLNTQMLIYLFSLYVNGKNKFGDFVPSGILYMSANTVKPKLPRNASEEQIDKLKLYSNKMSGLIIDDITAMEGMEKDLQGYFIPIENKKGVISGNIISLEAMLKLKDEIDRVLKQTAQNLHDGIIKVFPSKKACDYCDFKTVCGFEAGDGMLEIPDMSVKEAEQMLLNKGEAENNE